MNQTNMRNKTEISRKRKSLTKKRLLTYIIALVVVALFVAAICIFNSTWFNRPSAIADFNAAIESYANISAPSEENYNTLVQTLEQQNLSEWVNDRKFREGITVSLEKLDFQKANTLLRAFKQLDINVYLGDVIIKIVLADAEYGKNAASFIQGMKSIRFYDEKEVHEQISYDEQVVELFGQSTDEEFVYALKNMKNYGSSYSYQDEKMLEKIKAEIRHRYADAMLEKRLDFYEQFARYSPFYASALPITRADVEAYVLEEGAVTVYKEQNKGGYYDGKEDSYSEHNVHPSKPDRTTVTYLGDFRLYKKVEYNFDSTYQNLVPTTKEEINYKGKTLPNAEGMNLYRCEILATEQYLFCIDENTMWFFRMGVEEIESGIKINLS